MRMFLSLPLVLAVLTCSASGQDVGKIDRKIAKEPHYESKSPWYCLLVFGPEAKTKVWMVLDGKRLYVDRNANGDLTDDGESFTTDEEVRIPLLAANDGKSRYTDLRVSWGTGPLTGSGPFVNLHVRVRVGELEQYALVDARATKPDEAPLVHFDGPLHIELRIEPYKPQQHLTRGKQHLLGGCICTRYRGAEWVGLSHEKGIPADTHPIVDIEFLTRGADAKPIRVKVQLRERC